MIQWVGGTVTSNCFLVVAKDFKKISEYFSTPLPHEGALSPNMPLQSNQASARKKSCFVPSFHVCFGICKTEDVRINV